MELNRTESYFIPHCDESVCDMGSFHYTCPNCNKFGYDCEIWDEKDGVYIGEIKLFNCEHCKTSLTVEFDKTDYCYYVYLTEDLNNGV